MFFVLRHADAASLLLVGTIFVATFLSSITWAQVFILGLHDTVASGLVS